MELQIQDLVTSIRKEGIDAARAEADTIIAEAKKKAEVLCEEAKKALAFFPESKAKDALSEYCDFVMSRTY